jgi:NAD(P)-dependent dehydrogenase (short-subunit alcohol dehydrogenase family)
MGEFSGKTALITGSGRGIGRAAADMLASQGARIIYHGTALNDNLTGAAKAAGNDSIPLAADLSRSENVGKLLTAMQEMSVTPDILVLNASAQSYMTMDEFDEDEYWRMFNTNVASSCLLLKALLPEMRKKKYGRVIFVGSINGIKPSGRLAVYGASKAALMNFAKTCAMENAPYNITVNTILPGVIETDRNVQALSNEDFAAMLKEKIPMHRFGQPEECAELISFLASDKSSYITGAEIPIAGGWQL